MKGSRLDFSQVPTEKEIRCLKNGFLDICRNANTDTTLGTLARKIIIIKQPNKTSPMKKKHFRLKTLLDNYRDPSENHIRTSQNPFLSSWLAN